MRRKIALLLTLVFLIISVAVPCLAAEIDFNDYITNESVSGDDTFVTVSIPLDSLSVQWRLWNRTNGTWPLLQEFTGPSFTYTYSSSVDYALTINPFISDTIDVRDIPDGTTLTFSYTASGVGYSGDSGIPARVGLTYLDANGNSLGYVNGTFYTGQFLEDNAVPFTLNKPDGTVSIRPSLTFDDFKPIGNVSATISLTGVSFQFSIDSLLRLQKETGRTNKILAQIQAKLDGITDYVPQPSDPSGGAGLELEAKTDEILTIIQENIEYMQNLVLQWKSSIEDLASSFLAWADVLFFFINIPWVSILLVTSVCFGCCATLFGVVAGLFKKE